MEPENSVDKITASFHRQAASCAKLGSPFTARLLEHLAADIEAGGPSFVLVGGWQGDPGEDALALRLAGALHALVQSGWHPELAALYPPSAGKWSDATWPLVEAALENQRHFIADFMKSPPQTNEVGRSMILLGGFLEIARRFDLPLTLNEIGASAGLNLAWPQYRYETESWNWGDRASPLLLTTQWTGPTPAITEQPEIVARQGCDLRPVDLSDPAQRLRLKAYVWPDQSARLAALEGAIKIARGQTIEVENADAEAWLAQRLSNRPSHATTVVFHSVMMQYLPQEVRARVQALITETGEAASGAMPFCHLRFEPEPDRDGFAFRLRATFWPGGDEKLLAEAHPHGAWVRWLN